MIIIDSQQELADLLNSIHLDSVGLVRMDEATLEFAQVSEGELAFVHADIYGKVDPKLQSKLELFSSVLLFDPKGVIKNIHAHTLAVVDQNISPQALKNLINTIEDMLREREVLRSQLISINNELSDIMGNVEVEMMRVKKTYEQKSPRRFQDIKGVQVFSKYSAGENIGGEFFDIFMEQNKLFILMSATTSYLASSSILQIFSQFKMKKIIDEQSEIKFIEDIREEINKLNASKKKSVNLDLFTGIIDLNKHNVSGHLFGNFRVLSSGANSYEQKAPNVLEDNLEDGIFSRNFERGERILLCSPGFVRNWEKLNPEFMIEEMITNKKIKPLDILDEIFFQLKKDSTSGFLAHDASAIILEVQKNAMVEV